VCVVWGVEQTQKAILVVVRNTKALLAHEITESEYRETAKEVAEMMQKSMTGLVSLAVQLYKAIRIAEEKRKEAEVLATRHATHTRLRMMFLRRV